jgi:hypothetical protein
MWGRQRIDRCVAFGELAKDGAPGGVGERGECGAKRTPASGEGRLAAAFAIRAFERSSGCDGELSDHAV